MENSTLYSLSKKNKTKELHLFKSYKTNEKCYLSEKKSICKKMTSSESIKYNFTCESVNEARIKCAEIGRNVCGICVSHLYADYE